MKNINLLLFSNNNFLDLKFKWHLLMYNSVVIFKSIYLVPLHIILNPYIYYIHHILMI
jgi:hypothetical protein